MLNEIVEETARLNRENAKELPLIDFMDKIEVRFGDVDHEIHHVTPNYPLVPTVWLWMVLTEILMLIFSLPRLVK